MYYTRPVMSEITSEHSIYALELQCTKDSLKKEIRLTDSQSFISNKPKEPISQLCNGALHLNKMILLGDEMYSEEVSCADVAYYLYLALQVSYFKTKLLVHSSCCEGGWARIQVNFHISLHIQFGKVIELHTRHFKAT